MSRRSKVPPEQLALGLREIRGIDRLAFTPQEVADLLGVGLGTAYAIAEEIGVRVGPKKGRWSVGRDALLRHLGHGEKERSE